MNKQRENLLDYLLVGVEDDFGQFSGKRALGTFLVILGGILTSIVSYRNGDKIAEQTMLIAPLFATGLLFWGLTSWQTLQTSKQSSNDSISKQVIEQDGSNSNIDIKQSNT